MTETELKAAAEADFAHFETLLAELEPKKIEPVLLAAKGWLIATAFTFLVFGIVLGHYTALAK